MEAKTNLKSNANQTQFIPGACHGLYSHSGTRQCYSLFLFSHLVWIRLSVSSPMFYFPIICRSCMTIFSWVVKPWAQRGGVPVTLGGKLTLFPKTKSLCFLQSRQEWGGLPLAGPATIPEDLPRPSQFSCAFVGSFPQISGPSCTASFFLLPASLNPHFYTSLISAQRPRLWPWMLPWVLPLRPK